MTLANVFELLDQLRIAADIRALVISAYERAEGFGLDQVFAEMQLPRCESPIEHQLLAHTMLAMDAFSAGLVAIYPQVSAYFLGPQDVKITVRRLDFMVGLNWALVNQAAFSGGEMLRQHFGKNQWGDEFLPYFAIECDGRDSHSQYLDIQRDKQRDRQLTVLGLPIIRFTGSEIFKEGERCAGEVLTFFGQKLRDSLVSGVNLEDIITLTQAGTLYRGIALSLGYDADLRNDIDASLTIPF